MQSIVLARNLNHVRHTCSSFPAINARSMTRRKLKQVTLLERAQFQATTLTFDIQRLSKVTACLSHVSISRTLALCISIVCMNFIAKSDSRCLALVMLLLVRCCSIFADTLRCVNVSQFMLVSLIAGVSINSNGASSFRSAAQFPLFASIAN